MVAIAEKIPGPGGPALAHSLDQLADTYVDDGRYAAAETCFERDIGRRGCSVPILRKQRQAIGSTAC